MHHMWRVPCNVPGIGIERVPEQIAPAVDWVLVRSVEAALVNIHYAARPPRMDWTGRRGRFTCGFELRE